MPSQLHEAHVLLLRNRPEMAAELIRDVLGVKIPSYKDAQVFSADLTEIAPTEYRADLNDAVARWAAKPVETGGLCPSAPYVLGPSGVPAITSEAEARAHPELAVLSAMVHGRDADPERAARIATVAHAASMDLDSELSRLYFDLVSNSLSEAARRALKYMDISKYEYQSDFAKHYVAQGRREGMTQGEASGRLAIVSRLLALRFGPITADVQDRLRHASVEDLDAIGERVLFAGTLQEALGE